MNDALKFKSMTIEHVEYGDDKGKIRCRVHCNRYDTKLEVLLPDNTALEMMHLIAPIVAASVNKSLNDTARAHEEWMIGQQVDADAVAIEDGTGEGQIT